MKGYKTKYQILPNHFLGLQVPKSPRTPTLPRPGVMGHVIAHRFTKTYKMMTTCDYCEKQMFIGTGLKCKECKYKCHRDCESKVPPSCQLPRELLEEFIQGFIDFYTLYVIDVFDKCLFLFT